MPAALRTATDTGRSARLREALLPRLVWTATELVRKGAVWHRHHAMSMFLTSTRS
jgi:hypothetical protein